MTEKFIKLLEKANEKEFLSFLKTLDDPQRKELTPLVKKYLKEYTKFGHLKSNNYGYINGTDHQRHLLQFAAFVCCNMTDYEKSPYSIWMLSEEYLDKVIDWCVPEWFSDFVNKQALSDNIPYYIHYERMMALQEKGVLHASKELLAKMLLTLIFEQNQDRKWVYCPEKLLTRSITVREHIWHLFDVETNLHYAHRFLYFGKEISKEKIGWPHLFKEFAAEGKIDRQRLLKESLLASNKNFNKVLSGWFAQLFADFEPAKEELLVLQPEIFSILSAPHSKVVNTALDVIKKIGDDKSFDIAQFLNAIPVLLTSDTKAVVNSTLTILEKITKKHPGHAATIASLACQTFIHADDGLQTKAAKLVAAVYKKGSENSAIHKNLQQYTNTLMSSAKKILEDIISTGGHDEEKTIKPVIESAAPVKKEWAAIPAIENIDDLVFLASQAFDNNQTWHIAILPNELIKWNKQIRGEHIARFEPALQRALKLPTKGLNSQQGKLDLLLAAFFIDICIDWLRRYPQEAKPLASLFEKFSQGKNQWTDVSPKSAYLVEWNKHFSMPMYLPFRKIMLTALEKFRTGDDIPLLSAPTHEPAWIDPLVLTERLVQYQEQKKKPGIMDLQVAVSRCSLNNDVSDLHKAIQIAESKLKGEYRNLLLFLFDKHTEPQKPFDHPEAWMMASLAKKEKKSYTAFSRFPWYKKSLDHYTGQVEWRLRNEQFETTEYDVKAGEQVKKSHERIILEVDRQYQESRNNLFQRTVMRSGEFRTIAEDAALCDALEWHAIFPGEEQANIQRILLLNPNNAEPLLADILNLSLRHSQFWCEDDKRIVSKTLQLLHELWNENHETMAHVFVGASMTCADKTVNNLAAEIWIDATNTGNINSEMIGEVIGRIEAAEFAPVKRFTDLAMQQLFRISDKHNRALQVIVENILLQLPDNPVTNLKKLLEIYGELLNVNKTTVSDTGIKIKLNGWKQNGSIKKIAAGLLVNA